MKNTQCKEFIYLYQFLIDHKIIKSVEKATIFYDEPRVHHYAALLNIPDTFYFKDYLGEVGSSGISFNNPMDAILKCIYEAIERYSLIFWKERIKRIEARKLESPFLLNHYFKPTSKSKIGVVTARNLNTNKLVSIPAQSVYVTYHKPEEPFLSTLVTTGAAGDYDIETATNRALYEIVERDSFMTRFLIKKWPNKIDLSSINNSRIQTLVEYLHRYNLNTYLFDTTNDIDIPTFFCILADKTGIGPAISTGLCANIDPFIAIQSAILESLITRWWIRKEIVMNKVKSKPFTYPTSIQTVRDRAFYWSRPQAFKLLKPLFTQPYTLFDKKKYLKNNRHITDHLFSLGYTIYIKNVTNSVFKDTKYKIIKVVVPEMQSLYMNETKPIIQKQRLKKVSRYFGINNYELNKLPHPFL